MDVKDIAQIDAARRQFDEISAKARIAVFRKVLEHYQRHPGSPWSGAPLVDLERTIKAFYADLGTEYKTVFRETLPPLMKQYYDRALDEIKTAGVRNAVLGEPDAGRVKYFLESAFDQVAMKTQNMTANHIRELRRIAADVTRQMSVTGATRREVSKAMLDRAMTIPGFQFIDKAGNRWPLKSYFDTLARTELMNAARASYDDKVAEEGFDVMRLTTSGNCCEACARFEGELFSLTGATPGLPTKQDLLDAGVFHPNCTHSYSLVPAYIAEKYHGVKAMTAEEFSKTPMFGKKVIHGPHSPEQDAKITNPNYGKGAEWDNNCQRCVATYEARRRGYDVEALPIPLDSKGKPDHNEDVVKNWRSIFKNGNWEREPAKRMWYSPRKFVSDKVMQYGDGSRCVVYVKWKGKDSGAHVFIVENHGGKVQYIDPQNGDMDCSGYISVAEKGYTMICRIDNLEFSDYIKGCCKNRRI